MGQQTSNLNCKINQIDKNNEILTTKSKAIKKNKTLETETTQFQSPFEISSNSVKSPKSQKKCSITEGIIYSSASSEPKLKPTIKFPQFQCITKIQQLINSSQQRKLQTEQKQKTLGEIVQFRYNSHKYFPYSQIISVTECLIYSLAYFSKKGFSHHDFYPTNIHYINGKFKLVNPFYIKASSFILTYKRQRFSFLSPELIIAILQQKTDLSETILNKSDIFAIGMIILEMTTLQPSSQCYHEESYNIIDHIIKQRINKVAKIYTPAMADLLTLMLKYEIEDRLDPIQLAKFVHSRVQKQRQIASQLESGNRPKQQVPQLINNIANINPQVMPRGPPLPPYSHQPFILQNLNPNTIAVSMPNEIYTRISPNNQGFLSSCLQQKLRVIELIKEKPNQQDSEEENQNRSKNNINLINQPTLKPIQIIANHIQQNINNRIIESRQMKNETVNNHLVQLNQINNEKFQNNSTIRKGQVSHFQSIYHNQIQPPNHPLLLQKSLSPSKTYTIHSQKRQRYTSPNRSPAIQNLNLGRNVSNPKFLFDNSQNIKSNSIQPNPKKQIVHQPSSYQFKNINFNNFIQNECQPSINMYGYSVASDKIDEINKQQPKNLTKLSEIRQNYFTQQIKHEKSQKMQILMTLLQANEADITKSPRIVSNTKKLSQTQSLQQRVNRVLQMSRNVK